MEENKELVKLEKEELKEVDGGLISGYSSGLSERPSIDLVTDENKAGFRPKKKCPPFKHCFPDEL